MVTAHAGSRRRSFTPPLLELIIDGLIITCSPFRFNFAWVLRNHLPPTPAPTLAQETPGMQYKMMSVYQGV